MCVLFEHATSQFIYNDEWIGKEISYDVEIRGMYVMIKPKVHSTLHPPIQGVPFQMFRQLSLRVSWNLLVHCHLLVSKVYGLFAIPNIIPDVRYLLASPPQYLIYIPFQPYLHPQDTCQVHCSNKSKCRFSIMLHQIWHCQSSKSWTWIQSCVAWLDLKRRLRLMLSIEWSITYHQQV